MVRVSPVPAQSGEYFWNDVTPVDITDQQREWLRVFDDHQRNSLLASELILQQHKTPAIASWGGDKAYRYGYMFTGSRLTVVISSVLLKYPKFVPVEGGLEEKTNQYESIWD